MEVVTRYALTLHAENRLGDFAEAVPIELAGDVEPADALRQDAISRSDVRRAVPVRQVAAVEPVRGRLDLLVRDRWEAEGREDSLDRARSALAHVYDLLFSQRLDSPIDLPVALHGQPLVQVVGVVVAAAEHVVVARHHAPARCDEVGSGEELAHQLRRAAGRRVGGNRVVARGDLEVEPGGEDVLGKDLARAPGHAHHEGDAGDRAVLNALRARRTHER